ncbi:MAG: putative lipid II flippase FtsW [Candidatus Omnitrophica bacterium]|nr:putative lipid II flippase FtsW [Candidatus Omnitrophota bacterium]
MRNIRLSIFMITVVLICLGLVMVYSSSAIFAYETYGSAAYFLKRQLLYVLIGALLTVIVMSLNLAFIRRFSKVLFFSSIVLLILVYLPNLGREVGGARRWLKIGMLSFQPSELAKWATVLFLADILSKKQNQTTGAIRRFLFPLLSLMGVSALILAQPDLGSAVALAVVGMLMFFISGMPLLYIVSLGLSALPILYFFIFNVPYRRKRIFTFLNPWADIKGNGFQIVQSYLALGLGGLWGVGLGQSRQKLFYLPAAHTDFIFSILGEELGLIGTAGIVILFLLFLWQGIKISLRSTDGFIQLLSFGIVVAIILSACVHIAVVCGAVPTKGLPLPFISYGGSALILNMMAVGLLLNCARQRHFEERKL